MKFILIVTFLVLEVNTGWCHSISRLDQAIKAKNSHSSREVYEVKDDPSSLTFAYPKKEVPTLREIVYYHVIEKPYGDGNVLPNREDSEFENTPRTFTNSHGYQFLDSDLDQEEREELSSDESSSSTDEEHNNEIVDEESNEMTESEASSTAEPEYEIIYEDETTDGDTITTMDAPFGVSNTTEFKLGERTERNTENAMEKQTTTEETSDLKAKHTRKLLFDLVKEKYYSKNTEQNNSSTEAPGRKKRDVNWIPEAPRLEELDLESLPPYIRGMINTRNNPFKDDDTERDEDLEEIKHRVKGLFDNLDEDKKDLPDANAPKSYGMKIIGDTGHVWNNMWSNPGVDFDIQSPQHYVREDDAEGRANEKTISEDVEEQMENTDDNIEGHVQKDESRATSSVTAKNLEADSLGENSNSELEVNSEDNLRKHQHNRKDKEDTMKDFIENPYKDDDNERDEDFEEIKHRVKGSEDNEDLPDANTPKSYGMKLIGDTGHEWNNMWSNSGVDFYIPPPQHYVHEEDNSEDKLRKHKHNRKDKEDTMEALIKNEQFWKLLVDWTSIYMKELSEHIKEQIKEEVKKQIQHLFESNKDDNIKDETPIQEEIDSSIDAKPDSTDGVTSTKPTIDDDEDKPNISKKEENSTPQLCDKKSEPVIKDGKLLIDGKEIPIVHTLTEQVDNTENEEKLRKRKHKDDKNKLGTKDKEDIVESNNTSNKPSVPASLIAKNMFGSSVGSDQVTNIFIFYPNKDAINISEINQNNVSDIVENRENANKDTNASIVGDSHTTDYSIVIDKRDKIVTSETTTAFTNSESTPSTEISKIEISTQDNKIENDLTTTENIVKSTTESKIMEEDKIENDFSTTEAAIKSTAESLTTDDANIENDISTTDATVKSTTESKIEVNEPSTPETVVSRENEDSENENNPKDELSSSVKGEESTMNSETKDDEKSIVNEESDSLKDADEKETENP